MNRTAKYISLLLLGAALASSCVEPYEPAETLNAPNILVMDGYINVSDHSANVRITHAIPLTEEDTLPPPESNAIVTVEDFTGNLFALTESFTAGTYTASGLPVTIGQKYRLNVRTTMGKIYQSDYVEFIETPPIDSVTWRVADNNIEIMVNTHDDTGNANYFQWKFTETWKYTSPYMSNFIYYDGPVVVYRDYLDQNYICYKSANSTAINIGSTKDLASSLVRDHLMAIIPGGSKKIAYRYSILVQQTALSEKAYNYWKLLERTTQNLGGLFDPLPAQVTGNITCTTDGDEPVLGYFSGGSFTEQRIFISGNELPDEVRFIPRGHAECLIDSVLFGNVPPVGPRYIISTFGTPFPVGYTMSTRECTDCRAQGGQIPMPDFWIE